jgi:hypothetical protein
MELMNIEKLTYDYSQARGDLLDCVGLLQDEVHALKKKKMRSIKTLASKTVASREKLQAALEANPQLFNKPRSTVFYGIRVGWKKNKGKIEIINEAKVIERIKKHLPDQSEILVQTSEKVIKKALEQLAVADLKQIGCRVIKSDDDVFIKEVDSDIEKIVTALLKSQDDIEV